MPNSGYFDVPFAASGSKVTVPDGIQSDGSVSYTEGYGINYTLNPATNPSALEIEQTKMNQLFYDITSAIQYNQQGLPAPFITTAMNNGTPFSYAQFATVMYGGQAYISNVAGNTTTPPSTSWSPISISSPNQFNGSSVTGTANAIVIGAINPASGLSMSVPNQTLVFTPTATNTGASTLAVTPAGITATAIKKLSGGILVPLTGGELVNAVPAYLATDPTGPTWVLQAGPALGTVAPLNIGNNQANDGSGNLVGTIPTIGFTATSETYNVGQWGNTITRANGGSAMTDTIPGTSGALPAGWYCEVQNTDTGVLVISVGSGGSISMANQSLTSTGIIVLPGESYRIVSSGSGNYETIRINPATLHTAPTQGLFKNLQVNWVSTSSVGITADAAIVQDSSGNSRRLQNINKTFATGTSGAGGLDTGSIAANTWYFGYLIYKASTNTINTLFSTSATAPTLPSGYTYVSGPLTAFITDGSANVIGFLQRGKDWQYQVGSNLSSLPQMWSGSVGSVGSAYATVSVSSFFPTAICDMAKFNWVGQNGSTYQCAVSPNGSYGNYGTVGTNPPFFQNAFDAIGGQTGVVEMILESTSIYVQANSGTAGFALGFRLNI